MLNKVGVEGVVELSPEDVVVLGEGDQAELECKVEIENYNNDDLEQDDNDNSLY